MPISPKAIELENRSIGLNGDPTLAEAYKILKNQWNNGDRDREIGLHLMFLAWYGLIEPENLTGFSESERFSKELKETFTEVHDYFESQISSDAEMLYVFGLAADMFWYMFDNPDIWEERSKKYQLHYRKLAPNGIDPDIFRGRGAYGEYYAGHIELENGY